MSGPELDHDEPRRRISFRMTFVLILLGVLLLALGTMLVVALVNGTGGNQDTDNSDVNSNGAEVPGQTLRESGSEPRTTRETRSTSAWVVSPSTWSTSSVRQPGTGPHGPAA